jgi:serine phosphatase RsbU (regulator of sigma subunit)
MISLKNKIVIISSGILLVAVIVNSSIISVIYSNEHYNGMQTNAGMLAQNLSYQLEKLARLGLDLKSIEGFDKQCEDLVHKHNNISYAAVINSQGTPVFWYSEVPQKNYDIFSVMNPSDFSYIRKNANVVRTVQMAGSTYREIYFPVYDAAGNYIAAAGVGFSLRIILSQLKNLFLSSILISFGLCALSILLLILLLTKWVTNPINRLIQEIDDIRENKNYTKKIQTASLDELGKLAGTFNNLAAEIEGNRNSVIETKRLEKEMEIAKIIQEGILPKHCEIPGYETSIYMKPSPDTGGDYYDIIKDPNGNYWVNIGNVVGNGITAGIIMMMLQSSFYTAVNSFEKNKAAPHRIFEICNKIIYNNVKNRLLLNQFITACFFKCGHNGLIEYAGAQEHMIIYRSGTGKTEIIPTQGVWLGLLEDISDVVKTLRLHLNKNDILFLYTDGIIQMKDENDEEFTVEKLADIIQLNGTLPPVEIRDAIAELLSGYQANPGSDSTFLILRKA